VGLSNVVYRQTLELNPTLYALGLNPTLVAFRYPAFLRPAYVEYAGRYGDGRDEEHIGNEWGVVGHGMEECIVIVLLT